MIYFIFITIWGYVLLKDLPFLPPSLGGSGDIAASFHNDPYPDQLHWGTLYTPGAKLYSLVTMGYHVGQLLTHLVNAAASTKVKNDFAEMALHHLLTLYLYFGNYMSNKWPMGCMIAYCHDIADIWINACKVSSETKYKKLTVFILLQVMVVWAWTRLIVFPS